MQRDDAYLLDIVLSAERILSYVAEKSKEEFLEDVQCQDAVVRRLLIIGEAARRLSDEARGRAPELPWRSIVGQRNILVHEYDDVDLEDVWSTVVSDLPKLIALLKPLLPAPP